MIVESYEDVIVLSGVLSSNFWETIHTALSLILRRHPSGIIIDCSGITECSKEGAKTFIQAMEYIEEHDARILVASVPVPVLEVLKSVPEVRSQLPIASSVEEARRSLNLELPVTRDKKRSGASLPVLLVCLQGAISDIYLLSVAQEMADTIRAKLCLVYPIIVPRDLPLQAPLPNDEEIAAKTLSKAKKILEKSGASSYTSRVQRAREIYVAIQDALEEVDAYQILISLPDHLEVDDQDLRLIRSILTKIQRPLLFIRGPMD